MPNQRSIEAYLRTAVRPAVHLVREAPLWPRLLGRGSRRVIFLPAKDIRDGSSRLRIFEIARTLDQFGWHCLVLPPKLTLAQRRRMIRSFKPDVIFMQGVRHALNRPALYAGIPIVMDMDDADFHLEHLAFSAAEAIPEISCLIAGSRYVADWGHAMGARHTEVVWTGTPVSASPHRRHSDRGPVVAWAQTRPMTYVREADFIQRVLSRVALRRSNITFRLYDRTPDDDPKIAERFKAPGIDVEWVTTMPYENYLESLDDVAIGLAPICPETPFSRGKSFGKVLAYLDRKVPVIGSDACEHPEFFTSETGVITNDVSRWTDEICRLIDDAEARTRISNSAHDAFRTRLSSFAAARRVSDILESVLTSKDTVRSSVQIAS